MSENTTPFEAGLGRFVGFQKEDFIGRSALLEKQRAKRVRIGLKITGRGIARENCGVYMHGLRIGETTSGTHAPYLGYPVAMALADAACSGVGEKVEVDVRGRSVEAEIVPLPFYKREKEK